MENISIIGVGKLGLCFSLSLEKAGYNVTGIDVVESYVTQLNNKTFNSNEPGVNKRLKECTNFTATVDLEKTLTSSVIFVIVATPSLPSGRYDHKQLDSVVEKLMGYGPRKERVELVINATTMPGYCDEIQNRLKDYNYYVSYNPEFIAQGSILKDQENPDMVLIGGRDDNSCKTIKAIYEDMCDNTPYIAEMNALSAEITKLSLNCFLTTKISFANMIGDISEKVGGETSKILNAIGSDSRVGNKYLGYGYGYGGPCFPRDNRALSIFANDNEIDAVISKATDKMNVKHLEYQLNMFYRKNRTEDPIDIYGVTYKKGTDILEESQQLNFALGLVELGYDVIVHESSQVIEELKKLYNNKFKYVTI
tara:strand:+ start:4155 stop:5252 length:1098 start_codon:yes stop_codon:yes gene_type:complete